MIVVALDGLGMDEKSMLELVNRLNAADDERKWVLKRGYAYQQAENIAAIQQLHQLGAQITNPFLQ